MNTFESSKSAKFPKIEDQRFVIFGGGGRGTWGEKIAQVTGDTAQSTSIVEADTSNEDMKQCVQDADVIFLAASDEAIADIIKNIRGSALDGKMLLDCATSKAQFAAELKGFDRGVSGSPSICSTHPLVRADATLKDHNVWLMPLHDGDKALHIAEQIFQRLGMKTHKRRFEDHGKDMLPIQPLPHLLCRMFLRVLADMKGVDIDISSMESLMSSGTANAELMELAIGRVANLTGKTSARTFIEAAHVDAFFRDGKTNGLGKMIAIMRNFLDDIEHVFAQKKETQTVLSPGSNAALVHRLGGMFNGDLQTVDPTGNWREKMDIRTAQVVDSLKKEKTDFGRKD